ncbi:hypothetical protein HQ529_03140 [Candidatus Woesearchaeota archaeon]|nr:hypothetical protein [Candidatus Woesearchaeota archaeon]
MNEQELIKFFSDFWGIEESKINNSLKLDDTSLHEQTSIKLYQFFADVESKFNIKFNDITQILTFGNLVKSIKENE